MDCGSLGHHPGLHVQFISHADPLALTIVVGATLWRIIRTEGAESEQCRMEVLQLRGHLYDLPIPVEQRSPDWAEASAQTQGDLVAPNPTPIGRHDARSSHVQL